MQRSIVTRCICLAALVSLQGQPPAAAQAYPLRRIALIVPYGPGSAFDVVARTVGQKLSERWGQPVVPDNKPGASGTIGTEIVANAAPDGYTILLGGGTLAVYPSTIKNLRFDPVADFTPIGLIAAGAVALVVNPRALPVKSVDELIATVRAHPGRYNFSSPGVGTLQHLGMELFRQELHLDVVHVPYRAGALSAMPDLLSGAVQFAYVPVNAARPLVAEGKLRMLAVASSKRTPLAPATPSLSELGHPSLDFETWFGFFGPARLPPDIVQKWDAELTAINALPDVKETLLKQGLAPFPLNAAQTAVQLKNEIARWRSVVEKAGIKPE